MTKFGNTRRFTTLTELRLFGSSRGPAYKPLSLPTSPVAHPRTSSAMVHSSRMTDSLQCVNTKHECCWLLNAQPSVNLLNRTCVKRTCVYVVCTNNSVFRLATTQTTESQNYWKIFQFGQCKLSVWNVKTTFHFMMTFQLSAFNSRNNENVQQRPVFSQAHWRSVFLAWEYVKSMSLSSIHRMAILALTAYNCICACSRTAPCSHVHES